MSTVQIWSFGLSIMECSTGEYPYARGGGGKSYWELMDAIVRNDAPTLADPDFSGENPLLGHSKALLVLQRLLRWESLA